MLESCFSCFSPFTFPFPFPFCFLSLFPPSLPLLLPLPLPQNRSDFQLFSVRPGKASPQTLLLDSRSPQCLTDFFHPSIPGNLLFSAGYRCKIITATGNKWSHFLIPTVCGTLFLFSSMLLVLLLVLLTVTVQHALQKYWAWNQDPTSA